ncbi:hypothetical protein HN385_04410 [archaeon]|jgi:RNase P/RNase MRP subunit POP5|nr:hypothetical protein [archaeon]MBT3451380.1 hypothetical protein [archaeon]MBT6868958.1 hypothetical protein [archaeon]MBT7193224.1 hypothetical protein [archaeon]MBT7380079.1 hypothetical protein [archaeon]
MKLQSSLKEKKRYLVIEIMSGKVGQKFTFKEIKDSLEKSFSEHLGTFQLAKASVMVLKEKFNQDKQKVIVKVSNKYVDQILASLALTKEIAGKEVLLHSICCSGTLKKVSDRLG